MTSTATPEERKIGDLADATGVTVRTLRYYEEIGLLVPSSRTPTGHRLYGQAEVERLYRICSLRQLGMPLDGVRSSLEENGGRIAAAISDHLADLDQRLATENRLRARLARLVGTLDAGAEPTNELINVLEDMNMLEATIDRPIATLVYRDVAAALEHLTTVFGLGPGELTTDPDGNVVHGEVEAGSGTIWLHPESPDFKLASPMAHDSSTASMVVIVDDVDKHHELAVANGAAVRYEPVDQPYGYREYGAVDVDGHLWSFMKPLES